MNIDVKKITKTIMRKNRGLQDPQLVHPARDWAVGIVGTLVVFCIALGFSVWQYLSYTNLSLGEEVVLDMIPYKTEQVDESLLLYRDLSNTHAQIITKADTSTSTVSGVGIDDGSGVDNNEVTESDQSTEREDSILEVQNNNEADSSPPNLAI